MDHTTGTAWRSARLAAGILSVLWLTSTLTAPAPAAAVPPPPSSSVVVVDDSSATGCMTSGPIPIAYMGDSVVLRTSMSAQAAANVVSTALNDVGSAAQMASMEAITFPESHGGAPITPVLVASLTPPSGESIPIVALARRIRFYGVRAAPNYLVEPSGGPMGWWPNGSPTPASSLPAPRLASIGAGIQIALYDKGLPSSTQANIPPNVTRLTQGDVETLDASVPPDSIVDYYHDGHSVAIAGTIRTMAPGAIIEAARINEEDGFATDVTAARRMANTLRAANQSNNWPELIVAPFGSPVCDAGPPNQAVDLAPLGLELVTDAVDRHNQALVVASAGNKGTSRRYYPAAFPTVLAVGALDTTVDADGNAWTSPSRSGPRAWFSNYGPWVDTWASGVDLATTHVTGLKFEADGPTIFGMANVSGTSYSAPVVSALIAERMAATGEPPEDAWASIAATGTRCSGLNGSGVAVTLTKMTAKATTAAGPGQPPAC